MCSCRGTTATSLQLVDSALGRLCPNICLCMSELFSGGHVCFIFFANNSTANDAASISKQFVHLTLSLWLKVPCPQDHSLTDIYIYII